MLKADDLREFSPPIQFANGEEITLGVVQQEIQESADRLGIPVAFYNEQVKSGSLFNSKVEDCIVMYHPEHKNDYYKICVHIVRQGIYTRVYINDFGESKQMRKANRAEAAKEDRQGKSLSYKIGSKIGESIANIGKNSSKLEEEQLYYQCITDILDNLFR